LTNSKGGTVKNRHGHLPVPVFPEHTEIPTFKGSGCCHQVPDQFGKFGGIIHLAALADDRKI
jgi:hypothetical protein